VLLTEEHLAFALPWDVRLESKCPDHIHAFLFAHARELQPARQLTCEVGAPAKPQELASSPVVLLEALHLTVLVTTDELQETIGFTAKDTSRDTNNTVVSRPMGSLRIQQAFLRVMIDNLMEQLYQARDQVSALLIKARCAIVALLQRWQRQTHQRVVNAVPAWCEERHCIVWHLQVGVPALASALAA